jgi:GntR family transcriptional regulator/MocR family aminotransferase
LERPASSDVAAAALGTAVLHGPEPSQAIRGVATPLVVLGDGPEPIYTRLYKAVRENIVEGRWPAGTRLPSTRLLAADLGIARGTAAVAIDQLISEGWLTAEIRSGVFVAERASANPAAIPRRAEQNRLRNLTTDFRERTSPTRLFPVGRWRQHHAKIWGSADPMELLISERSGGHPSLREAIARLACGSRGITAFADQVVVCSSARAAVEIALLAVAHPRALIAMESPGDPLLAARLRRSGYRVAGVQLDEQGLITSQIPLGVSAVIVSPTLQQPLGMTMSSNRRRELRAWADANGAFIVELDCDGHLAKCAGKPVLPLYATEGGGNAIYVRDFDRVTFPGLSLAFMLLPAELAASAMKLREEVDRPLPVSDQLVLADFLNSGGMAAHLRQMSASLAEIRSFLLGVVEPYKGLLFQGIRASGSTLCLMTWPDLARQVSAGLRRAGLSAWTADEFFIGTTGTVDEVVVSAAGNDGALDADVLAASFERIIDAAARQQH